MQRREFMTLLGGAAAAWPLVARAQPSTRFFRIGYLGLATAAAQAVRMDALRVGLSDLGYIDGRNTVFEYRWAEGLYERLPHLAMDLVRLDVDVIVTHGTPGVLAAKRATATIPIVMTATGDAVASGLVSSILRPGGNVTGITFFNPELAAKRLELLKEAVPGLAEVAILMNSTNPMNEPILPAMKQVGRALELTLIQSEIKEPNDLQGVFEAMTARRVGGLVILDDPVLVTNADSIARLALRHRLPSSGFTEFGPAGGLTAYGVSFPDLWRRSAAYVDKVLKGVKPADLPVERPTKFLTIVNLKTARALGIDMPTSVLLRADEVIE
jgi:ABC-type uncharacterized transport system substrate-binding protein